MANNAVISKFRGPRGGLILMKKEFEEIINKGCPLALGGPLPHVLAAKAIAFQEANTPAFKTYAAKIVENANALAQALIKRGARLVTGGTENHLMVADVRPFGLTGRQAETILREAGLTLNRNSIPFDPNGPWYTSGIRLGTPAMTTLGMGTSEMDEIADIILSVLKSSKAKFSEKTNAPSKALVDIDPAVLEGAKKRVKSLLSKYPLYPDL